MDQKHARKNILTSEKGIAESIGVAVKKGKVNKTLASESLDILKQLQMGNLDINELKNLQNNLGEGITDTEKKLVKAIKDALINEGEFLNQEKKIVAVSDKIKEQWNQNQIPILVGGTGLYFKALTDGLVEIPDIPNDLRTEI